MAGGGVPGGRETVDHRHQRHHGCHVVAVGGRGTLTGAVLGAVLVNYGKTYFTSGALAPYWLFVLGGLFVVVTLFLPQGILGLVDRLTARRRRPEPPAERPVAPEEQILPQPVAE